MSPQHRRPGCRRRAEGGPDLESPAAGLAASGDERAVAALARLLAQADPDDPARARARDAVALLPRDARRLTLERIPPRHEA
ncbi:hypothetical protein [Streptomyces sp. NRRL F-5126]|uniref:hypothetical protein n=1 Tax=Streptomyces sp. NRRL F-5126 TaxID=1463857 RepID=UPI00131D28D2|nr:hypothetical protein [Streptomyces sp. NRRL F-5126]